MKLFTQSNNSNRYLDIIIIVIISYTFPFKKGCVPDFVFTVFAVITDSSRAYNHWEGTEAACACDQVKTCISDYFTWWNFAGKVRTVKYLVGKKKKDKAKMLENLLFSYLEGFLSQSCMLYDVYTFSCMHCKFCIYVKIFVYVLLASMTGGWQTWNLSLTLANKRSF